MTPIELLALTRLISDSKAVRNQVSAGNYNVDFNIHVSGSLRVGNDTTRVPTVGIPWTEVYALLREVLLQGIDELVARADRGETIGRNELEAFRQACGLSEDLLVETIQRAHAMNEGKSQGSIKERLPEIAAAQERAKEAIARRLEKTPAKGMVKSDLKFEQIQADVSSVAEAVGRSVESVEANLDSAEEKVSGNRKD